MRENKKTKRHIQFSNVNCLNIYTIYIILSITFAVYIMHKSFQNKYIQITHDLLNTTLCSSPPDVFAIYYHQAINITKSKICKP